MANSNKLSLAARTLHFGSNFAAGALMLSRMNRSEISRYDDLVLDLCRLRAPGVSPAERREAVPVHHHRKSMSRFDLHIEKMRG